MWQFGLTLLVAASLSYSFSAVPSFLHVFTDAFNCVHLRCEWRGVGEHCKPANSLRRAFQRDIIGWSFPSLNQDESDAEYIARIKRRDPVNTFTIVNDLALGEMCEERRLWCNVASRYYYNGYEEFFEHLRSPIPRDRPKLHC